MSPSTAPDYRRRRIAALLVLMAAVGATAFLLRARLTESTAAPEPVAEAGEPEKPLAALNRARSEAARRKYRAALEHVERALAMKPDHVDALLLKSELLDRLDRSDEMIPLLNRAIELDPQRFEAHANLAYAMRYAGRLDEAEREVRWCLARRPRFVPALRILAEIHRDRGRVALAVQEVRRALRIDPHDLTSGLLYAELLLFQREYEAAYERLVPLLRTHPNNRRVLATIERAARLSNRPGAAARYRERLSPSDPVN